MVSKKLSIKNMFSLRNNIEKNCFKYFLTLIIKNWIIRIIILMSFLTTMLTPPILLAGSEANLAFFKNSFMILVIPFISSVFLIGFISITIFSKTKTNNIDLFLSINPIEDKRIVYIKQLTIMFISSQIVIALFISSIIMLIMGLALSVVTTFFLMGTISLFLMNLIWIFLFSFLAIHTSYWTGSLAIISITLFAPFITIIPLLIKNNKKMNLNFDALKYKENLVKVYSVDDHGKVVKESIAIYEEPSATENRQIKSSTKPSFETYLPFSSLPGFMPSIMSPLIKKHLNSKELANVGTIFSVNNIIYEENFFDDVKNYKNISMVGINQKSIFDYSNKIDLFNEIENKLLSQNTIATKIKNNNYWRLQKNELSSRQIWDATIAKEIKQLVSYISGTNESSSILYEVFNANDLIYKQYLNNIKDFFAKKYSKEFAEFLEYIWRNQGVKLNIFAYDTLGKDFHSEYHPSIYSYDSLKPANKYDLAYIKNYFFHTNSYKNKFNIQVLNKDGVYEDLINTQNVFNKSITTRKELDEYLDGHNTINNLRDIVKRTSVELNNRASEVYFRNNIPNTLKLNREIKINTGNKYTYNALYVLLLLIIAIFMQRKTINKVEKGDMKWN